MSAVGGIAEWLCARLPEMAGRYGVPGAVVAVRVSDEVLEVVTGVLSTRTGVEADTESIFQIGSLSPSAVRPVRRRPGPGVPLRPWR